MPLGNDQQYGETLAEQDKIRRRLEIKNRLKHEDPAVDRYADLRKMGRMPGAPMSPKLFFTLAGGCLIPIFVLAKLITWEREDWIAGCESGDIPYEKREGKTVANG